MSMQTWGLVCLYVAQPVNVCGDPEMRWLSDQIIQDMIEPIRVGDQIEAKWMISAIGIRDLKI
jgi:hypothetical protein